MAYIMETTYLGVRCDATGCFDKLELSHPKWGDYFGSRDQVDRAIQVAGWSVWVGRSRKFYCPSHGPSLPTKMRRHNCPECFSPYHLDSGRFWCSPGCTNWGKPAEDVEVEVTTDD